MRILVLTPGYSVSPWLALREVKNLELDVIYSIVGQPFDRLALGLGIDIVFNDEGKINRMPPCLALINGTQLHDIVMGPIMFVGCTPDGDYVGLTDEQRKAIKAMFGPAFLRIESGIIPTLRPVSWPDNQIGSLS